MKKNKKYPLGGTVEDPVWDYLMLKQQRGSSLPNTIENPNTALADNQTRLARAELKSNNGLTKGLDILGALGMKLGTSMMSQGISNGEGANGKGVAGFLNKNSDMFNTLLNGLAGASSFAKGGRINQGDVEVEGGEMFETPEGQVGQFNGPNHENGGIPLKVKKRGVVKDDEVPDGTFIYSDRTKIGNKTIADRKKQRDNKEKKIEKILGDSSDMILKNTLNRVKELNLEQDALDRFVQESTKNIKETKKFRKGGRITEELINLNPTNKKITDITLPKNDLGLPDLNKLNTPKAKGYDWFAESDSLDLSGEENNKLDFLNATLGDVTGMLGNLYQGYKPLESTINASLAHTFAAMNYVKNNYSLTPDDLIEEIKKL